jgi:hypothetical protein
MDLTRDYRARLTDCIKGFQIKAHQSEEAAIQPESISAQ